MKLGWTMVLQEQAAEQSENPNYSGWVKIFGDNSFIEPAFEYARKYAPEGCKLYYNDFNEYSLTKPMLLLIWQMN